MAGALPRGADYIFESECVVNAAVTTAAVEPEFLRDVVEAYSHDLLYYQEDAECPSRTVMLVKATVLWLTESTQLERLCIPDNQASREKLLAEGHGR